MDSDTVGAIQIINRAALPDVEVPKFLKNMLRSFETATSSPNKQPPQFSFNDDRLYDNEMCCSVIDAEKLAKLCKIDWAFFWNNTFKTGRDGDIEKLHLPDKEEFSRKNEFLQVLCHAAHIACGDENSASDDKVSKDDEVEKDNQGDLGFKEDRIFDSLPAFGDDTDENLLILQEDTNNEQFSDLDEFEEIVSKDLHGRFQRDEIFFGDNEEYDDDDDDKFGAREDNIYRDMQADDDGKKYTTDVEEGSESLKEKLVMMEKYADGEMKKDEIFTLVKANFLSVKT